METTPTNKGLTKRGVGYCENSNCQDYSKGIFVLTPRNSFQCPRCAQPGFLELESGSYTGNSDIFKEVRVEYNFDPIQKRYRETAIVRDDSLEGEFNIYTLKSPLIKSENRGLKVAEAILANLNRYRSLWDSDCLPKASESLLSFDDSREEFNHKLGLLFKEWEASGLGQKGFKK